MFGYEGESDDDTIIVNYDDSSSDILMPSDVTVDSDSHSENDTDNNNNRQPWPVPVLGNNGFTNELSPIVITMITITCNIISKPVNVSFIFCFQLLNKKIRNHKKTYIYLLI